MLILFMHALNDSWLVLPALRSSNPLRFWAVIPAFAGIGGLWAAVFTWQLKGKRWCRATIRCWRRPSSITEVTADEHAEHAPPAQTHSGPRPGPGYETKDVSAVSVLSFGVGLIIALAVIQLLTLGFYRLFISERPRPIQERAESNIYGQLRHLRRDEDAALFLELRLGRSQGGRRSYHRPGDRPGRREGVPVRQGLNPETRNEQPCGYARVLLVPAAEKRRHQSAREDGSKP